MKTMTFCFDHPVAVKVFFICTSMPEMKTMVKSFRSDEDGLLKIPLNGMVSGLWKLMMEWTYDGRDFCMEKKIKISSPVKIN